MLLCETLIAVGPILQRIVVVERETNSDRTNITENCSGGERN